MKALDTGNKRPGAAVDDILEELRGSGTPRPARKSGADVDDILAELGVGKKPGAPRPAGQRAPVPRPAAAPPAKVAAPVPEGRPAQGRQKPSAVPKAAAEKPADLFENAAPKPRKSLEQTTILDIEVAHTESFSRVGKAAALDKVEEGKYSGDTELLSWFSGEEAPTLSKREQRQMEKERKRQEAADRKAAKRGHGREEGFDAEDGDELPPLPSLNRAARETRAEPVAVAESTVTPSAALREQPAPTARPLAKATPGDDGEWTVTGGIPADEELDFSARPAAPAKPPQPAQKAPVARPVAVAPTRPAAAPAPSAPKVAPAVAKPVGVATPATPPAAAQAEKPVVASAVAFHSPAAPVPETPPVDAKGTQVFEKVEPKATPGELPTVAPAGSFAASSKLQDTRAYEIGGEEEGAPAEERVPTAAFTQEFDSPEEAETPAEAAEAEGKNLFLDDMVDDKFRAFFGETVMVDKEDVDNTRRTKRRRGKTKSLFTGEFAQLEQLADEAEAEGDTPEDEHDYNRPQDAEAVEKDLVQLRTTLTGRLVASGVVAVLMLWLGLAYTAILPVPGFLSPVLHPMTFGIVYLVMAIALIGINFNTVAAGLVGLVGEPTVDSAPALAALAALLQAVVVLVSLVTELPGEASVTLFGFLAGLVLCANLVGKRLRASTILKNFQLASAGFDHSAGFIVDGARQELAYNVTDGLQEDDPVLLVSRPTQLVKGFMRQSFSLRWSDGIGRILGWVLVGVGLAAAVVSFVMTGDMLLAVSCFAAALCISAPFASSLVSAVPSLLMQQNTSKVGAVVPGWSAIEDLGDVNVVMAGARDLFPPSSVQLKGIKTYQKERIDIAILYAASVLIEACDTMRDIFVGVIQGKNDMLYKVESLTVEQGRGFTAWVENHRVVIGTREMLQKHAITPPPIETELKYTKEGNQPVYLAVSGKLFAMFVVRYSRDKEVAETLQSLVRSGVSLLVTSDDMNVTDELIASVYGLPEGVVKVLGQRELDLLEPMTSYIPESDGVMTHIGTFTSFIGGMSAAANCAASERMSVIAEIAAVAVAGLLSLVLAFGGGLASISLAIALLFQIGWTVIVCALPFTRRFG